MENLCMNQHGNIRKNGNANAIKVFDHCGFLFWGIASCQGNGKIKKACTFFMYSYTHNTQHTIHT
jgi:hypothetical protein